MNTAGHRTYRSAAIVTLCLGALLLAACSSGGSGGYKRGSDGKLIPTPAQLDPAGTLYAETVGQAESGQCDDNTLTVLTCFAYRGRGYEGAQTALGQCLIRARQTADGVAWLRRAADAGWPDAQKHLAELYLAGKGVKQSNVEAATWNYLYIRNPSMLSLGVQADSSVSDELNRTATSEEKATARRLADAWSPTYWQPNDTLNAQTAATCRVRMKKTAPDVNLDSITNPDPSTRSRY